MSRDGSLPSYERLFGDLDFRAGDESRTVYSPAAYLADLLQLLDDNFTTPALTQPQRRPDLKNVVLDRESTFTESPYLDLVNEVLGNLIGDDPDEKLATLRFPFNLPFRLQHERLKQHLHHLQVSPVELYRLFASNIYADVVAQEYLGLSPEDVDVVTRVSSEPDLKRFYQLGERESFKLVEDVDRFRRATLLTTEEIRELLFQNLSATASDATAPERSVASRFFIHRGGARVTLDLDEKKLVWGGTSDSIPFVWFDRVNRFVRLARKTDLSLTDLDLVLRTCCGNSIDPAALRIIAVVIYLQRISELPIDVVCSLAAPITTMGIGDQAAPQDLFNRIFNTPFTGLGQGVIQGSTFTPPAYVGRRVLTGSGDLLAARNQEYRQRVAQALAMTGSDITLIVTRFRRRAAGTAAQPNPFD
ncbi:MAG: Tc toxin subunit A, partial [Pseudonocardiaceae bacterium]